ncbi:MAG: adenine deaminase [Clostridia bacterium]|nr:adenine deaminase [Clostridia bacterium]
MTKRERIQDRINMAAGREPVELVLENCKIVNVFNHKIMEGNIAIDSGKIIGIGNYTGKETLDMKGRYIAPGLIDSHEHLESAMVTPAQMARVVVPRGTTTIIADPHEIANVCGLKGIEFMMDSANNVPLNVFFMLPSCVPATEFETSGAKLLAEDLSKLIKQTNVLGLGELMDFPGVISGRSDIIDKILIAQDKIIDGHGPVIKGKELNAYMISGVKTDHECSTLEEMEERLDRGMYIAIREGSAARNLKTLIQGVHENNARRMTLCTDDKSPEDILKEGHIDFSVRKAISLGIDPITAIQMATINTAECYHLRDIGGIAPGYDADLIVLDDLKNFNVLEVFKKGVKVAEEGKALFKVSESDTSDVVNTVNMKSVSKDDLQIKLNNDVVRVISVLPFSLVTESNIRKVNLDANGHFEKHRFLDIVKLAVVERHKSTGNIGLGLVENFKIQNGAIATTIGHDSHNMIVIGDNDEDMLTAIAEVRRLEGGIAVVHNKKVDSLQLRIGGLMSDQPMEFVAKRLEELLNIAHHELQVNPKIDPFMTLSFLALPVIPDIKLTDKGLFDVLDFKFVDVEVNE